MASLGQAILGLLLVLTSMAPLAMCGWNPWDLGLWSSAGNDTEPWYDPGTIYDTLEDEQEGSDDDPHNSTTYASQKAEDFDGQSITTRDYSPTDGPSNVSFSGSDQKEGDEKAEGFGRQLFQKTVDFFSGLLSHSGSGIDGSNSTETDDGGESDLCRDGDPFSNCSSESISLDQDTQDVDGGQPSIASTDAPTTSDPSLTVEPTWIDAAQSCLRESIDRSVGECGWEEARALESDLFDVFNVTIVKRLAKKCVPGEWCLHKHFGKDQTLLEQRSCHLMDCLDEWKDDNCRPSNIIWNTLNLLCTLTNSNTSGGCVISVLKMTHVTIADMIRIAVQPEDEESICSRTEDKEFCSGPCQKAGQNLKCMSDSCENNTYLFEGFAEWQWLFGKSGAVDKCQFNASDCQLFEAQFTMTSHDTAVMPHHGPRRLLTFLKTNEWSVVAGLGLSVLFSLLVVCGIFVGLRVSGRRRLRQRMLRHNAMARADDGGLTSRDRIQYTIITTQQDEFDDQDSDDMT